MHMNMTDAKQPIFCLTYIGFTIAFTVLQSVHSSGYFELRLKSFEDLDGRDMNNTCCDDFDATTSTCEPCDHFIFVCLLDGRDHGHGPCVSNNVTTQPVNNTNNFTFGTELGAKANPFKLEFNIPSRYLVLHVSIYDDDMYDTPPSEPDLLKNMTYTVYTLNPQRFSSVPYISSGDINENNKSLAFEYVLQCDTDFYSRCDQYCPPDPLRYNCNSHGGRICNDGWMGRYCTYFDYCRNQTCLNGGTCTSLPTKYSCNCNTNYTGLLCEVLVMKAKQSTTANVATKQQLSNVSMTTPTLRSISLDTTLTASKDHTSTMTETPTILSLFSKMTTAAIPTSTFATTAYATSSTITVTVQSTKPTRSSTLINCKTQKSPNRVNSQSSVMSTKIQKPRITTTFRLFTDTTFTTSLHPTYHMILSSSHGLNSASTQKQGGIGNKSKQQSAKTNNTFPKMVAIIGGSSVGLLMLVGTILYCIMRMKKRSRVNDRTEKLVEVQDESPNIGNNVSLYNNNIIDW